MPSENIIFSAILYTIYAFVLFIFLVRFAFGGTALMVAGWRKGTEDIFSKNKSLGIWSPIAFYFWGLLPTFLSLLFVFFFLIGNLAEYWFLMLFVVFPIAGWLAGFLVNVDKLSFKAPLASFGRHSTGVEFPVDASPNASWFTKELVEWAGWSRWALVNTFIKRYLPISVLIGIISVLFL